MDNDNERLKALGYRKQASVNNKGERTSSYEKISTCVNRLRDGDTTWQLYAPDAHDPIGSQGLAVKIAKDYEDGKLDFLEWFHIEEKELAKRDPFRITRYDIVKEAEEMAPHKLWNLEHIKTILKSHSFLMHSMIIDGQARMQFDRQHENAITLLTEYDALRSLRLEAEVTITDSRKAMRKFRSLPRYLSMLYEMHYRTEYPDAPESWASRAAEARVEGKLGDDERLSIAADDAFRYQAWLRTSRGHRSYSCRDAWLDSIDRLSKTKPTRRKFRVEIKKRFDIEMYDKIEAARVDDAFRFYDIKSWAKL